MIIGFLHLKVSMTNTIDCLFDRGRTKPQDRIRMHIPVELIEGYPFCNFYIYTPVDCLCVEGMIEGRCFAFGAADLKRIMRKRSYRQYAALLLVFPLGGLPGKIMLRIVDVEGKVIREFESKRFLISPIGMFCLIDNSIEIWKRIGDSF
jgi:hypothetical protein